MTLGTGDQIVAVVPMPNGGGDLLIFTVKGGVYRFHVDGDGMTPTILTVSEAGAAIGNGG